MNTKFADKAFRVLFVFAFMLGMVGTPSESAKAQEPSSSFWTAGVGNLAPAMALPASYNWMVEGNQSNAVLGTSVGSAGDVNGDGYADVIVTACGYDSGDPYYYYDEGKAYVYYGSSTGLSSLPGWTAESAIYEGALCRATTAGDVNGDGFSDVIAGMTNYTNGEYREGGVFVWYGSALGLGENGTPSNADWKAESDQAGSQMGGGAASAGDVNGDGYSDVIAAAHHYSNGEFEEGMVFVWYGSANGLGENGTPSNADWTVESNQSGARLGFPVSTAGDVNGDGYSDVLVGAHLYDHDETDEGAAFLYFGSASGLSATPDWIGESNQEDARYGQSLAMAGDVNGDGYSDIIIGSTYYDNPLLDVGKAYVYYGSASGPSNTVDWTVEGAHASASMTYNFGVSTAGDVNDDGYADVVIGSPSYTNGQTLEGLVSVYLGSAGGLSSTPYWTVEGNSDEARLGYAVNTAGDVNGDGLSDLIVSAAWYTNDQFHEGAAFAYYSGPDGPLPAFGVRPHDDEIEGWWWPQGAIVTVTIEDPNTLTSPDYSGTSIVNIEYPGNDHRFRLRLNDEFDVLPGQVVIVSDGNTTKQTTVTDFAITDADVSTDIVSGLAEAGSLVHLWICTDTDCANRHVFADSNGNWIADFSIPGLGTDPNEQLLFDIVPGTLGDAAQWDADGDGTSAFWRVLAPYIEANPTGDWVRAREWPLGTVMTLTIDNPSTPQMVDYTTQATVEFSPWYPSDPTIDTLVNFDLQGFDVQPGDIITASGNGQSKTLIVSQLAVIGIDIQTDTISGTGTAGVQIHVCLQGPNGCINRYVTADGFGNWTVNYAMTGVPPGDLDTFDIGPGSTGWVAEYETDLDRTGAEWAVFNPIIFVEPNEDNVFAWDWPLGTLLTLEIEDPATPQTPDYTASQVSTGSNDWNHGFRLGGVFDIQPGHLVTVSDGNISKQLVVTNFAVTNVDVDADTVSGIATPGSRIHIGTICDENGCANRNLIVDLTGNWLVDFHTPVNESWQGIGTFDLRPGSGSGAYENDEDGDSTKVNWRVPNPTISVRPNDDHIEGSEWDLGSTVTIEINDPATPANPDYADTATVGVPDWDPNQTWFNINTNGYDLKAGDIVTVTDGSTTKQLVVSNFMITNVNLDTDTVYGSADPGQRVNIWTCWQNNPCINRDETADADGYWFTNFGIPGEQDWEQEIADLRAGSWIDSSVNDEDGDSTMFGWSVPNPTFSARMTDNEIHGYGWPLGASVTLIVDNPNTPPPVDFTKTQTAMVADWNPNETYAQFKLWEDGFTLEQGMTVTMTDGITTKTHVVTNLTVTEIDTEADTISGTASPNAQVEIGHISCDENGCYGYRRVTADSSGNWIADFAHVGEDSDEQDIIDITIGMGNEARECDDDWDCTQFGWYVFSYTLHAVPTHPEVHGHDWPSGADVTLTIDDDTDPGNGVLYTRTKNVDDDPWCGSPCFDLSGAFELQVGQYVTMTDGTVTKTVQVSTLKITSVDIVSDTLSGTADPGSDVMINIWSQDGKARHTVADSNGDWTVDFSVPGDEDFEQFTTDIDYGDNGRAIQLNPDGTDDGTLEYWNQDWVAPDTIPLVVAHSSDINLDRLTYTMQDWTIANLLWEPLFRITDQSTLMPAAASNSSISADGLVYTITLRDDLLWSDGQPVTAQQYVDGFLRLLAPDTGNDFNFLLYDIQGAEAFATGAMTDPGDVGLAALNEHTLQVTLAHPAVYLLQVLATPGMVPARLDVIAEHGGAWTDPGNFVGNGPYTLVEHDGGHLLLQKNPQFHDAANVSLEMIAFDIVADANEQFEAYKRGEVDVVLDAPQAATDDTAFDSERVYSAMPGFSYISLNTQRAPTDDPLVRKALASAIDRRALLDDVLHTPWLEEATGVIPPELLGYQGNSVGYEYNSTFAQGLLAGAGYPGGVGLPTVHIYGFPRQQPLLDAIAEQWRNVLHISVETHYIDDFNAWIGGCENAPGDCSYNAFRQGWWIDYYDANNIIYDLFNPDTSMARRLGWDNARYRELLDLSRGETDPAQRLAYLNEAEQILVEEDAAVIPLYFTKRVSLVKPGFQPIFGVVPYFDQWTYQPVNAGQVHASLTEKLVWAPWWPMGDMLTLEVYNADGNLIYNPPAEEVVQAFFADFEWPMAIFYHGDDFTMQPGYRVVVSNGEVTKEIIVAELALTEVNINTDRVTGTAAPGAEVIVNAWMDGILRRVTANGDGDWLADFSTAGDELDEQNTLNIGENTSLSVDINYGEVGRTYLSWPIPEIRGTVLLDGLPLEGVEVWLNGPKWDRENYSWFACTDENGRFVIQKIPPGPNEGFLSATGPSGALNCANAEFLDAEGKPLLVQFWDHINGNGQLPAPFAMDFENQPYYELQYDVVRAQAFHPFLVQMHVVDLADSGACPGGAATCDLPLNDVSLKAYDRDNGNALVTSWVSGWAPWPDGGGELRYETLSDYTVEATYHDPDLNEDVILTAQLNASTFADRGDGVYVAPMLNFNFIKIIHADGSVEIYSDTDSDADGQPDLLDPCPGDPENECNVNGSASSVITPDGGAFATEDNLVNINVPAGAVNANLTVNITDTGGGYEIATYQGAMMVFQSYSIEPHGTHFNTPVTLTFRWNDADNNGIVDGTTLQETKIILIKDGLILTPSCSVNPACNTAINTLTIQVTDLSLFEIAAPANHPPQITAVNATVDPVRIGQTVNATATFSDVDSGDSHNAHLSWGDGSSSTLPATPPTASATHTYSTPGVYTVTVTITDAAGASDTKPFQYIVVYDPNGGFATGGGWFTDPATGSKANFGFNPKYQTNGTLQGETEFKLNGMKFKSTSLGWMVINGPKAIFMGTGTINGSGNYVFLVSVIDGNIAGDVDKVRIVIWNEMTGEVVYDNQPDASEYADPTMQVEGGSIVIHKAK